MFHLGNPEGNMTLEESDIATLNDMMSELSISTMCNKPFTKVISF